MSNISKRIEAVERTVGATQGGADLPHPLETLSADDRALVNACREARRRGDRDAVDTPESHAAMQRYIRACAAYDEARRAAGVPMRPVGETIRERLAEMRRNRQEAA